jgi:hypothetical protein
MIYLSACLASYLAVKSIDLLLRIVTANPKMEKKNAYRQISVNERE